MFSVIVLSVRREFGIGLAIGSQPRNLLRGGIAEGTVITALGIGAGFAAGLGLERLAGSYFEKLQMPGAWVVAGAAVLLLAAAVVVRLARDRSRACGCDSSPTRGLAPGRQDTFSSRVS